MSNDYNGNALNIRQILTNGAYTEFKDSKKWQLKKPQLGKPPLRKQRRT